MLLTILMNILLQADIQMADGLRADGKFWVVIAIVAIVTIGILIYLFMLDKKVRKLEEK
jgi:CcmD family protein